MPRYYQGKYKPQNPAKYRGDPSAIFYRSSWELKFMQRCDNDPSIISWGSEEIIIPYKSPIDGKIHRYFPDFIIEIVDKQKNKKKALIEIKPLSQCSPPKVKKTPSKRYINEVMTWGVNEAKWKAASAYCKKKSLQFIILTEKELGITF